MNFLPVPVSPDEHLLAAYQADCQPLSPPIHAKGGFSGAVVWKLETRHGPLALRRWPPEHPSAEQLQTIHAVLAHVDKVEPGLVPAPIATRNGRTWISAASHFWEMTPWLSGQADFLPERSPIKLTNAMHALAKFHQATRTLVAECGPSRSLAERKAQLEGLCRDGIKRLAAAVHQNRWPELKDRGRTILQAFGRLAPQLLEQLAWAAAQHTVLQPCIRDVKEDHVLFDGDKVTGIIDFGAMRTDTVALDVSRLLRSLANGDPGHWASGLQAYRTIRPISEIELSLIHVSDGSSTLLSSINWLSWIYLEGREFSDRRAVLARVDELISILGLALRK